MLNFKAKDFIAALSLIGFFTLKLLGAAAAFEPAITLILGYYFVKRENGQDNGH